jgi:hypothetical protein
MDRKFGGYQKGSALPQQSFWLGRTFEAEIEAPLLPEPRHSVRRSLNLEVLVNHSLTYSVPLHVRDFSLTGAYVEMDTAELPEGSYVEMVVRYRYKGRTIEHRLPATVSRVEPRGMALTFGHYDDETYTDLTNLLYAL